MALNTELYPSDTTGLERVKFWSVFFSVVLGTDTQTDRHKDTETDVTEKMLCFANMVGTQDNNRYQTLI